ncbi:claudin domain containing protein-like protein [Leptotrombidium deliense]|uniref:Claudin domain containing protein-like protein n=1 Tax=Leptotrombidium deliense TaxID=299467 RepID=A0A443SVT6_9ACAR|nr:claudin domain containing protein-like protein [Leptotrombidium deliense]
MTRMSDARIAVVFVTSFAFIATLIAFFSPNWLASERRFYGAEFDKLGLWETCFRSLRGADDLEFRKYYSGCRWIFAAEYQNIRGFLQPVILLMSVQVCHVVDNQIIAFQRMAIVMFLAAVTSSVAVIVFGIKGDDADWMAHSEHNFLSWSFALAVVGTFFEWIAAILFWVENRLLIKKDLKRQREVYGMQPMMKQ